MTNLVGSYSLTILQLVTNAGASTSLPDGSIEQRYVVSAEVIAKHQLADGRVIELSGLSPWSVYAKTNKWTPAPLPTSIRPIAAQTNATMMAFSAVSDPDQLRIISWGITPECQMFKVSFLARTNRIYGLECSPDFINWSPRPPEVNGEDAIESFYDALEDGVRVYRLVSRVGVLPNGQ